jgi:hypothetical protein
MSHEFVIISGDHLGHEQITVEVRVHEQYASNDIVKTSDWALLDTQSVVYEDQYYKDQEKCKEALERIMNKLKRYVAYNPIPIILTLPDPPPPYLQQQRFSSRSPGISTPSPGMMPRRPIRSHMPLRRL